MEGDWDDSLRNSRSILPALHLLEQNVGVEYIHRTCGTIEEFNFRIQEYLSKAHNSYKGFEILYFAFHGEKGVINLGEATLSLEEIAKKLEGKMKGKIVHFGSCKSIVVNDEELDYFIKTTNAKVVSGYTKNIDFISSTAMDILYFEMCQQKARARTIKTHLKEKYGSLMKQLEFVMYYKA